MGSAKTLTGMSLKELWELFPIVLVTHDARWKEWAENEMRHLALCLSGFSPTISHIGSTAIPDMQAKPIIDILVEVSPEADRDKLRHILELSGYICMSAGEKRMSFNKGYTIDGYADKVFHVHIHHVGDNDEIFFRDYLISHPGVAKEYEALKLGLLPQYTNDRDGYTAAKTSFIKSITSLRNNKKP